MKKTNSFAFTKKREKQIFQQQYPQIPVIEGVRFLDLKRILAEEGDFAEIFRLTEEGKLELVPDFGLRQINRTELFPGSIKAWHVHQKQDEIWYVPPTSHIIVGLWDLRKGSTTEDECRKVILGSGQSKALFIPRGVAHGSANYSSKEVQLYYFVNQVFNINDPDEMRLHWDAAGNEFWDPERD